MKDKNIDIVLVVLILVIVSFGVLMVYSASNYHAILMYNDPFNIAKKQAVFAVMGVCVMLFIGFNVDYRIFSNLRIATFIYVAANALVALLPWIGDERKGAVRWIVLGPITIQPSEIVKIATLIMISAFIVHFRNKLSNFWVAVGGFAIVGIPTVLVLFENLSSAIVIGAVGVLVMFVATKEIWYYAIGAAGAGGFVWLALYLAATTESDVPTTGIIGIIFPQYRLNRFRVWLDPWIDPLRNGYQSIQSLYAIGAGGLFGRGLGMSIQKQGFLPEPHNDIIFSVICEELGFVGAACVLIIYSLLIMRGLMIAINAYDLFGSLLAVGLVGLIAVQVIINVAVNTNTFPTTGMQLPLISYGGTALVVLLAALGILLNISKYSKIEK
ncbi:FtsW/RodA/SpoVE family cell cycle protein [Candidatus Epulonipiscium viviparus]|uniref:FtsW/RodA/SpoVE family cell cycle protein n=1 Tax=Candidatus Epulonipiscium viviparus TaxID=420336 RepID=UPI002738099A|nr:FtsW/RodA/SpoVE family cell cycle protein [Candidatus Epulopiscium viviparus]